MPLVFGITELSSANSYSVLASFERNMQLLSKIFLYENIIFGTHNFTSVFITLHLLPHITNDNLSYSQ